MKEAALALQEAKRIKAERAIIAAFETAKALRDKELKEKQAKEKDAREKVLKEKSDKEMAEKEVQEKQGLEEALTVMREKAV